MAGRGAAETKAEGEPEDEEGDGEARVMAGDWLCRQGIGGVVWRPVPVAQSTRGSICPIKGIHLSRPDFSGGPKQEAHFMRSNMSTCSA